MARMNKEQDERLRERRVAVVMAAYDFPRHIADTYVKAWYRGQNNKGRHLAHKAIVEAGLIFVEAGSSTLECDVERSLLADA
jgi:hypothetical protein